MVTPGVESAQPEAEAQSRGGAGEKAVESGGGVRRGFAAEVAFEAG